MEGVFGDLLDSSARMDKKRFASKWLPAPIAQFYELRGHINFLRGQLTAASVAR